MVHMVAWFSEGLVHSCYQYVVFSGTPSSPEPESALVERSKQEKWSIWSLREGTQQLADSLGNHLQQNTNVEFKMNSPCTKLELIAGKARVRLVFT